MSNLTAFFAESAELVDNVFYPVSRRFKDEDGQPIQWELKAISGAEDEELRRSCVKRVPAPGRKGQYQKETDYDLYLGRLAVACVVFPNLNDSKLQDSYHVMGADSLLKAMLTNGEYADLLSKVQEVCGFDALENLVDEAKN